jgi:hypothetical protein
MRFWVVRNNWFPIGYHGIVLWPFVFTRPYPTETQNKILFRHELQHCYQIKQRGVIRFYVRHLWLLMRRGYWNHPDEIEAREAQLKPLTAIESKWYETNKIRL